MAWMDRATHVLRTHVPAGSRVLIAVSGGPDSVALAHFLRSQLYTLVIGHIDHALRKGSSRDAAFVRRLARVWDLPCHVKREKVMAYATARGIGLEEAARVVRYQALAAMAKHAKCSAILTAHTADDQAETVMMNFLRGAGGTGLSGMPHARRLGPSSKTLLLRPFLRVRKEELLRYLKTHSLPYRRDPTNRSLRYSRNRIRLAALPYLEKLNPGLRERLTQTAEIFRQEEDFWCGEVVREFRKTVRQNGPAFTVVLPRLLGYHKALSRRILRRVLPGSSFQDIEQVLQLARSPEERGCLEFPGGWRVRREKKKLVVFRKRAG